MTSAETYAAMVDAYQQQYARFQGARQDRWGGETAGRFRMDPHRPLSGNLAVIASYVGPEDVVVDVGGGAGRVGLPLALRCRELINADPSPGMQAAFRDAAEQAGIKNARSVEKDWLQAEGVEGDVCLTVHVTYFVRDIVPFIRKLEAAARKRVMICVNSFAMPNSAGPVFELLRGEPFCPVPGHRELLPVLWDMGILPEVRPLPEREGGMAQTGNKVEVVQRRLAMDTPEEDRAHTEKLLYDHFDELYVLDGAGYVARTLVGSRGLLITWEPGK